MAQFRSGLRKSAIPIASQLKWSRNCDQASPALTSRITAAQNSAAASDAAALLDPPSFMPSFYRRRRLTREFVSLLRRICGDQLKTAIAQQRRRSEVRHRRLSWRRVRDVRSSGTCRHSSDGGSVPRHRFGDPHDGADSGRKYRQNVCAPRPQHNDEFAERASHAVILASNRTALEHQRSVWLGLTRPDTNPPKGGFFIAISAYPTGSG